MTLNMKDFISLDTETTGLEPGKNNRLIEIACCKVVNNQLTEDIFHEYINPTISVGTSEAITGITDDMLKNKPIFGEIAEEFLEFIKGSTLVIHNASFDLSFLNYELKLAGFDTRVEDTCEVIDSLEIAKQKFPNEMHNLESFSRFLGILDETYFKGTLINDAKLVAQVFMEMMKEERIEHSRSAEFRGFIDLECLFKGSKSEKNYFVFKNKDYKLLRINEASKIFKDDEFHIDEYFGKEVVLSGFVDESRGHPRLTINSINFL